MQDPFLRSSQALPVESAVAVTPGTAFQAPSGNPTKATRAILIGGAGTATVTVTMADGSGVTLTFPATACGMLIPIAITAVTAGTATGIVAFY